MTVPGTYRGWRLFKNPAYAGTEPTTVEAACHDGTPFLTVGCPKCGTSNHLHESQIEVPDLDAVNILALRCATCRRYSDIPLAHIRDAFEQMRSEGWIE